MAGAIEAYGTTCGVTSTKKIPRWHGGILPFLVRSPVKINRPWRGSHRIILIIGVKRDDLVLGPCAVCWWCTIDIYRCWNVKMPYLQGARI